MARKRSKRGSFTDRYHIKWGAFQQEVVGLLLLASGIITLLALFSVTRGALSDRWVLLLRRAFGWGAYPVAMGLSAIGLLLLQRNLKPGADIRWETIVGMEILLVVSLALFHLLTPAEDPLMLALQGRGGGYVGWAISSILIEGLGQLAGLISLLVVGGVGLALTFVLSPGKIKRWLTEVLAAVASLYQRIASPEVGPTAEGKEPRPLLKEKVEREAPAPARSRSSPKVTRGKRKPPSGVEKRDDRLPALDILNHASPQSFSQTEARRRARLIEDTLSSFGVPVDVVEINQGPVVTQFGVQPGYIERRGRDGRMRQVKVRVRKIKALVNDLALALAAAPLRIEAPVPGRPLVGIEVPNEKVALVSLREVMESEVFQGLKSKLKIALGQDISGQPVVADLATMPHLLIAGATGSGKSVCINSILTCLLCNNTPDELQLLLFDPKMVELTNYNGIPHLLAPVVVEMDQVVGALTWVTREMDDRYHLFSETRARNVEDYNRKIIRRKGQPLPYIVVAIDELADLMMTAPDEVEWGVCRIAQMARATGIHLVIATQRPSVDVVTGLIKANFPARISFAVTSQVDSRVVLDTGGAESLLGRGDMLYMASDSSRLVRLQGCFVSDEEINRLVRFWRRKVGPPAVKEEEPYPWIDLMEEEERDELLDEAIALVKQHKRASASFLQRRLRVGYPRAARLIDLMEEEGIIGPDPGGGQSREVLELEAEGFLEEEEEALSD